MSELTPQPMPIIVKLPNGTPVGHVKLWEETHHGIEVTMELTGPVGRLLHREISRQREAHNQKSGNPATPRSPEQT